MGRPWEKQILEVGQESAIQAGTFKFEVLTEYQSIYQVDNRIYQSSIKWNSLRWKSKF